MQPRPLPEGLQPRGLRDRSALREDAARFLEGSPHGPRHQVERDEVEHERGDHLAHTQTGAQERRQRRPERPTERRGAEREREVDPSGQPGGREADRGAEQRARVELPLGADVPDARAERERDRKPREDERHGAHERDGENGVGGPECAARERSARGDG